MVKLPKHMPHNPVRIVRIVTKTKSPSHVTSKTAKATIKTITVCPVITTNCVTTCPKRISVPVTPGKHFFFLMHFLDSKNNLSISKFILYQYLPETKLLSSKPSFLSSNIAPDVSATDRKKMILKRYKFQL